MSYELEKSIGFKINQTANKLNNKYNQLLQEYDIAPEQRATLEIIKYETDVNQTKIANILGKDKRTNLIEITPKGEDILNNSFIKVNSFRKNLISKLNDDEVTNLILLLEKVALSVEEKV